MGGIYSEFATEVWARNLGLQSEGYVEVSGAALNTQYGVNLYPPAGYEAWIPHKFTFALPLSSERGDPKVDMQRLATVLTTYGTAASITVGATPRRLELLQVMLNSDNYAKTNWRLTIGGTQQFTDLVIPAALSLPFRRGYLAAGEVVLLEAASTDGTAIVANGAIVGREYTPYEWQIWVYKKGVSAEEHTAFLSDDILRDGVGSWVYVTKGAPLRVEIRKLYGRAGDHILVYAWASKVARLKDMDQIMEIATRRGVQETLPFSPVTGQPVGAR